MQDPYKKLFYLYRLLHGQLHIYGIVIPCCPAVPLANTVEKLDTLVHALVYTFLRHQSPIYMFLLLSSGKIPSILCMC